MTKQIRKEYQLVAAMVVSIVVVALLLLLIPRSEVLTSLTSRDLDESLYDRIDAYVQAYEENPQLSEIFDVAMTDPESLTESDRLLLLAQEREFFDSWELAWTYSRDGYLDSNRYTEWNSWYIGEVQRRPLFVWTENRSYFSVAFAQHVDSAINLN